MPLCNYSKQVYWLMVGLVLWGVIYITKLLGLNEKLGFTMQLDPQALSSHLQRPN